MEETDVKKQREWASIYDFTPPKPTASEAPTSPALRSRNSIHISQVDFGNCLSGYIWRTRWKEELELLQIQKLQGELAQLGQMFTTYSENRHYLKEGTRGHTLANSYTRLIGCGVITWLNVNQLFLLAIEIKSNRKEFHSIDITNPENWSF